MSKPKDQSRVDRWVNRAKNHPLVAFIIFLALIMFAIAKLADSGKTITDAWDRWHNVPPKLLIEPVFEWQPGVDISNRIRSKSDEDPTLKAGPEFDISWIALLAVTNLTDRPVTITEFDPAFMPVDKNQAMLAVESPAVIDAFVAETEDVFHEGTRDQEFRAGSITLPPGSKRYVAIRTFLVMTQRGRRIELTNLDEANRLVLLAIGGDADHHPCRVVIGPFGGVFRFADNTSQNFISRTSLFVPGCYVTVPLIQK